MNRRYNISDTEEDSLCRK